MEVHLSRRVLSRWLDVQPPDDHIAEKYLMVFPSKVLYHRPSSFPSMDSRHLFGNDQPLEIEIGCGSGDFICYMASKYSDVNFVGIDNSDKPLFKSVKTAHSYSLDNVKFIRADFLLMYPLLAAQSLSAVYLHFPDPHSKKGFHGRRIFTEKFLDQIHVSLKLYGTISVMTDHKDLFMDVLHLIEQDNRFRRTHDERYIIGRSDGTTSRFQQIWEGHGLDTYRIHIEKFV